MLLDFEIRVEAALEHLYKCFSSLRTGSANTSVLEHIQVECYGTQVELISVAAITAPDKRNLIVRPFDSEIIPEIEKAIHKSNVGLSPVRESKHLRLPVPSLSEERRLQLVKEAGLMAETQKIAIRNIRRDILKVYGPATEDDKKKFCASLDSLTQDAIHKVELSLKTKTDGLLDVANRWQPDPKGRKR